MYSRLQQVPLRQNTSFFLFGPRGTGKTTWLKTNCPDALFLDLLDSRLYLDLVAQPARLENLIPPDFKGRIVLDEIQKIPALLDEVHRLIENRGHTFIMTGSSARSLRKKGVNLLAGRALTWHMFPLTAVELGRDFDLERSIQYGHLPMALAADNPDKFLKAYVTTYLKEEVLQEGLTRSLGNFTRFLEAASFSQGNVLNISDVAREAGLNRKMAEGYFAVLEDMLLAVRVPVFTRRARRRMAAHPKFYFFDAGVYRAIRPRGPLDAPAEIDGISLETLVFQEICAINHYFDLQYDVYYWRTSTGEEVDFVLYGPRGMLAFEVKRARRWATKDLAGLKALMAEYPEAGGCFFYGGDREEYHSGITVMPVKSALARLPKLMADPASTSKEA